jgi:hypothetical protein
MSRRALVLAIAVVGIASAAEPIRLNEKQYFEAPGFSFLLFHNNYQVGFQGGLQMIQAGERLLDSGDLFILPEKGGMLERRVIRRTVDAASATVFGQAPAWKLGYEIGRASCRERV